MGAVYKAYHKGLARAVAVKVLALAASREPQAIMRFKAEAASMNALDHTNIAKVHSFGMIDEGTTAAAPYLVLEYVDGGSLADKLSRKEPMQLAECWAILSQLAAGLAEAHTKNIVHRDIKPSNIMFSGGTLKIVDFGIAKSLDSGEGQKLTQTGALLGTPLYMSPEQLAGQAAGTESDIYSVGCILHEMLYNKPFVTGESVIEIAMNQTSAGRNFLSSSAAGEPVPKPLRAMLQQMLELERKTRIPDGKELCKLVQAIQTEPDKMPDSLRAPRSHASRRLPLKKLALLLLPVITGTIVAWVMMANQSKSESELMSRLRSCRVVVDREGDQPEWHQAREAIQEGLSSPNEQIREFAEDTLRAAAIQRCTEEPVLDDDAIWILDQATRLPITNDSQLSECCNYYFCLVKDAELKYQKTSGANVSTDEELARHAAEYFARAADELKKHNYKFPHNPTRQPTMVALLIKQMIAGTGTTIPRMNGATSTQVHDTYAKLGLAWIGKTIPLAERMPDTFQQADWEVLRVGAHFYRDFLKHTGDVKGAAAFEQHRLHDPFWQDIFNEKRTKSGAQNYSTTGPLRGA